MKTNFIQITRLFVFVLFILLSTSISAASFRHLSVKEGLSSRQVYQVCKDSVGFVWIYTHMGVDRYDGNEIRHYELDQTNESRDQVLAFTRMEVDGKGNLWVALRNGKVYRYDRLKDAFALIIDLEQSIPTPTLNDIVFEEDNGVWLCLSTGVYFWDYEKQTLSPTGLINEWVNCIVRSDENTFFAGTNTGVYKLKKIGSKRQFAKEKMNLPMANRIERLFLSDQKLYVGTFSDGVFVVELPTEKVRTLQNLLIRVPVRVFARLGDCSILIGTDGEGVYRVNVADGRLIRHYSMDEDNDRSLNGNTVTDICIDKNEGIWISTSTNGLNYQDAHVPNVDWVRHERNTMASLASDHVNVILQDSDGDFWYGTNDGISLYRTRSNQWTHFLKCDGQAQTSIVLALCEDNDGSVWAGGYGIGLYRINKKSGEMKRMPKRRQQSSSGIATDYIYSIYSEGDCLWFGGIEGDFVRYNRRTDTYTYYPIDCIGDIESGSGQTLLIAGCNGLGFFNKSTGEMRWQRKFGEQTLRYPIRSLMRSSSGEIWLLTDGDGLIRFHPKNKQCRTYTMKDGLVSNSINSIVEDGNGRIWFNTEKELYCLNLVDNVIISGNEMLGISWGYYNANAALKTKEGLLVFGTAEGALAFTPAFDFSQRVPVKLVFTDFKLPYESVKAGESGSPLEVSLDHSSNIKLKYNQNSFSISFSAINFTSPHKIRYEYRLKNYEQQWHRVDNIQTVSYMDLPSGNYVFELRAFDRYTQQQVGERTIKIAIDNPFWASWWAVVLYLILLSIVTFLFVQFRRQRASEEKIREKIHSFISIAHDIRTPISLIKAPLSELERHLDLSEENRKRVTIAARNADKLFSMINQLMNLQKAEQEPTSLNTILCNVHTYIEDKMTDFQLAAMQKGIELQWEVESGMPEVSIDKEKMDHILDNLLSNALKYTERGTIYITVRSVKKKWSIEVRDTGIGVPQKEQAHIFQEYYRAKNVVNSQEIGSGIGLMITRRMVQQHQGTISFDSVERGGTTFMVTFPQRIKSTSAPEEEVAKGDEGMSTIASETVQEADTPNKNLLLLVEDDKDMRDYLTDSLSSEYKVISAPDGGKALEIAKEVNPDIIISDIVMPVLQGDELCKILKSSVDTSHIPVILLTALSERENIILGLEAGATDYIIKPFDLSVLKVRLRNILQSRQHLRETVLSMDATIAETDYTTQLDKEFLDKVREVIEAELTNSELSINDFCRMLGMSRTSVYNKIKTLTGLGPNDFIRIVRLNKAKELIHSRRYAIGEIASLVGFSDPKYFSTCFKKQFGVSPSKI